MPCTIADTWQWALICCWLKAKIVEKLLGFEVTSVACGASHMVAVTNEHEVFAWGRGDNGWYCMRLSRRRFVLHLHELANVTTIRITLLPCCIINAFLGWLQVVLAPVCRKTRAHQQKWRYQADTNRYKSSVPSTAPLFSPSMAKCFAREIIGKYMKEAYCEVCELL